MGAFDLIAKAAKGVKKAPFFSKADVVLDELQRGKGTGQEFLTELVKKGVKPTELKDRGIDKALKDMPKVTKAEVQKLFEQKAPPKVQEKVLGPSPDYDEFLEAKAQELYGTDYFDLSRQERSKIDKMFNELGTAEYEKYKTPGGENYREILLKLPAFNSKRLMELEADIRRSEDVYRDPLSMPDFRAKLEELQALKAEQAAAGTPYTSSHYKQDPNLLAHIRVQDFKTPEGKKVLLVDEIQSDWHQAGRDLRNKEIKRIMNETGVDKKTASAQVPDDFGYGAQLRNGWKFQTLENGEVAVYGPDMQAPYGVTSSGAADAQSEAFKIADKYGGVMTSTVPDAPFKKNWHELAMKRVLDYATENGYDTVAITPGAEQAKRYDLSKQISKIDYNKFDSGQNELKAWDKDGKKVFEKYGASQDDVANYIGKEAAEKLFAATPKDNHMGGQRYSLIGEDLQVGGEGMKGFYDKILPDYLNNYGKQYGAQVGELDLITKPEVSTPQIAAPGIGHFPDPLVEPAQTIRAHSFDITPQMREQIKTKGQPLYSQIGIPGAEAAAGVGAATIAPEVFNTDNEQQVQNPVHFTENPDAMLLELMQRN